MFVKITQVDQRVLFFLELGYAPQTAVQMSSPEFRNMDWREVLREIATRLNQIAGERETVP